MPGFNSLCQRFNFLRFFALPVAALQRTMQSVKGRYIFTFFFCNPQGIRDQGREQEEVRGGGAAPENWRCLRVGGQGGGGVMWW